MSAYGKYRVIAADTLDDRTRHRQIIEQKLKKTGLTPALQLELNGLLKRARVDEKYARDALADAISDEEKEDKDKKTGEGGDSGDGSQSGGGSSGGGSSAGGDGGGMRWTDGVLSEEATEGLTDREVFELLFLLIEMDNGLAPTADSAPVDAATLLFNRDDGIALVNEPYTVEHQQHPHAPSTMLHAIEQHAASVGARTMLVNVHVDHAGMVDLFRQKGYQLYGGVAQRNGLSLQRMRKTLTRTAATMKSMPD